MAHREPRPAESIGNHDRLNGWKEIASHLGKSVRTVQRWEKELELPIRRIHTPGGEIVYAFQSEIESWQLKLGEGTASRPAEGAGDPGSLKTASRSRRWLRFCVAGGTLALLAVAWLAAYRFGSARPEPGSWRVEDNRLKVQDANGKELWQYQFNFTLGEQNYRGESLQSQSWTLFEDLDNDGAKETLFHARRNDGQGSSLFCIENNGRLRFSHQASRTVHFGSELKPPPFFLGHFLVTPEADGTKAVWAASRHNLSFPAVLQKLTFRGSATGEYWSNGHITALHFAEIAGRRYVLVGATNNEHKGASLAVLDYDKPTGSAPTENPAYRCMNCPPGQPLAFLVFPRMEISREVDQRPYVSEIRVNPDQRLIISVQQANGPVVGEQRSAPVFYTLDSRFRIINAEIEDAYRQSHAHLELRGRLKHRFGERDERELFPVLSWDGQRFVQQNGPAISSPPNP